MDEDFYSCPVCGFTSNISPFYQLIDGIYCCSFDICPCCGVQSGYTYNDPHENNVKEYRQYWLTVLKGEWQSSKRDMPANWNREDQMKNIPPHAL